MKREQAKKSTTKRTPKTTRKETSQAQGLKFIPLQKGEVDVRGIEEGRYWIPDPRTGKLVNMLVDAAAFDELITQYGELYDRTKWVPLHRKWVTDDANGIIPILYIADEDLPEDLREARAACRPKEEQESPKIALITEELATKEEVVA